MSGEKKAKGWRFYGLVGFGAIALLSAGVWALQYAGSGPEKTLSPLVVHNNLQIDLNEPDLFLDSDSLSQLPKDLLTIPFLHDVLSEDFVFYYQNHADRLGIEGSIRRIVYEHDLTLKDKLFSSLLDQPAQAALWHDKQGHLSHYMVLIQRSGLSKLLEPLLFAATSDSQLSKTEISSIKINSETVPVYQLRYMKIYVIKIAVHGVSPMVWRRLRIAADTSLAALHFIFQIVQDWGDDHLHQFHIYGKDYGISYEGGIGFVDNPFRVVIDDFAFDAGDRFTYEYNFFEHWLHDIRVEAIYENSTLKAPFCISGHGMPGATAADEFDKTLAFLEAIVNADDETTVGEIRPFADDLDAVRFNRHKINRQLSRLDLASPVLEPEVIWLGRRR